MSDNFREGLGDKLERNVKPDSQKSTTEQAGDKIKGAYESVAGSAQPNSEKSATQRAGDAVSGDDSNNSKSFLDSAKDTLGLNNNKPTN